MVKQVDEFSALDDHLLYGSDYSNKCKNKNKNILLLELGIHFSLFTLSLPIFLSHFRPTFSFHSRASHFTPSLCVVIESAIPIYLLLISPSPSPSFWCSPRSPPWFKQGVGIVRGMLAKQKMSPSKKLSPPKKSTKRGKPVKGTPITDIPVNPYKSYEVPENFTPITCSVTDMHYIVLDMLIRT